MAKRIQRKRPKMTKTTQIRIKDKRSGRFIVDDVVLNGYGKALGPYGITVYVTLCRHANMQSQQCWPSHKTMANKTGMSVAQIKRELDKIQKLNLINRETEIGKHTIYTLLEPKEKHYKTDVAQVDPAQVELPPSSGRATTQLRVSYKGTKEGTKEGTNTISRKKKYSSIKDITNEELDYIANYYGVSRKMVDVLFDRMKNWLEAKGKNYKNYKKALMNWVSTEKQRVMERRGGDVSKQAVDARNI